MATNIGGTLWEVVVDGKTYTVSVSASNNTALAAQIAVDQLINPPTEVMEAAALRSLRASLTCSPLQGRLALGETISAQLDAIEADPETPWELRTSLKYATVWERNSDTIAALGLQLGFTDEEMDQLFIAARQIKV